MSDTWLSTSLIHIRFITYAQENWHLFMLGNNTFKLGCFVHWCIHELKISYFPSCYLFIICASITDFCYFVNLSVTLQTAFFPDHLLWYKVKFIMRFWLVRLLWWWEISLKPYSFSLGWSMHDPCPMCHNSGKLYAGHGSLDDCHNGLEEQPGLPLPGQAHLHV